MPDAVTSAGDARRKLPSVDRLLAMQPLKDAALAYGHVLAAEAARQALAEAPRRHPGRAAARRSPATWRSSAAQLAAAQARGTLYPVINATGVIIHTNLGRAPLSTSLPARPWRVSLPAIATSNMTWRPGSGGRVICMPSTCSAA